MTTSPLLALPVLSTAIPTAVRVGCVLSIVTLEPSLTAVTATPAVPPTSVNAMEKVIAPLPSSLCVVTAHFHVLPDGLVTCIEPELSIALPAPSLIVQVGEVWIVSDETKVSVTTSPSLAFPLPAVAIPTEVRVGAVVSST